MKFSLSMLFFIIFFSSADAQELITPIPQDIKLFLNTLSGEKPAILEEKF